MERAKPFGQNANVEAGKEAEVEVVIFADLKFVAKAANSFDTVSTRHEANWCKHLDDGELGEGHHAGFRIMRNPTDLGERAIRRLALKHSVCESYNGSKPQILIKEIAGSPMEAWSDSIVVIQKMNQSTFGRRQTGISCFG